MANELKNAELCHSNYSLSQQTTGAARRLCIFTSVNRVCSPCLFFFFVIFTLFYFTILYWFCHTLSPCFLFQESGCLNGILEDDGGQGLGQKRAAASRRLSC